jgi:hypothetical protein
VKYVYRVWYGYKDDSKTEAFFELKEQAEGFADYLRTDNLLSFVSVNQWSWRMEIEM